ncbi:hypothetical protein [Serratia phage X20]|uniref:Uncharacterized protein n=1 Tax=Serratia phage X20 TaxID=2006942 RepID=A0A1Z1LZF1_9CAUD|nr:hypothetical protein KNT72_gp211 [Serratia phage X20]ARW58177.1 hypothetical protein [Serratia phage X20]
MKAYLETVVIARKAGGDVSTSCSQIILEFFDIDAYHEFRNNTLDSYEKAPYFEVYRTLLPIST